MLQGLSHWQAGKGKVKEISFKDFLATGSDTAQSPPRLQHFSPATKQPSARSTLPFIDPSKETPNKDLAGSADQVWAASVAPWVQHWTGMGPWSLPHGFRKDNSTYILGHVLRTRTETTFAEAEWWGEWPGLQGNPPLTTHASGSCLSEHHFLIKNDHCKS